MRIRLVIVFAAGCALALLLLTQFDFRIAEPEPVEAGFTEGGTEACLKCHGGETMTMIAATAHGDKNNPYTPYAQQGCESCHGPGSLHVSRARGGTGFPALLRFGDRNTRPEQTAACLDCHGKQMGKTGAMKWAGSPHDTPRITCVSCHSIHTTDDPLAEREGQVRVCSRCHARDVSAHPVTGAKFDRLKCSACHDVHVAASRK